MWLVDCTHYIDDLYHIIMHHQTYAATGDVVKFFILELATVGCGMNLYNGGIFF